MHSIPYPQESLLHQVFGQIGVAHDAEDYGVGEPAEAIVEIRHGVGLAPLQPPGEFLVVLPAHFEREQNSW